MNKIAITLFLLFASLFGNSQQQVFSGYTLSDGLSQSVVNCIFQDSQGFIWLGTQNGLNKFDGYTFEIHSYRPDDLTSISNNWIYAIAEDRDGNLWIGTKGGLNKFNRREKRFERISYSTPFPNDVTEYVYDVKCAQNGDILINTPPVLTFCNPVAMTFTHHVSPLPYDGSVKDYKIPLLEAADGLIWMGSTKGVACFRPETKKFDIYANDPKNETSLSNDNITALFQDNQSQIWIGTQEGLNQFNAETGNFIRFLHDSGNELSLNNNFIRAIEGNISGSIWIGTEGGGVSRMHSDAEGTGRFEAFTAGNSGLLHNHVFSLAIDRSRNLWIGSLSGLNKTDLKKQKFRLYRNSDSPYSVDLAGNVIASIFKDDHDFIWIGYWGQGLDIFDRNSGKVEHFSSRLKGRNFLPNDFVHTIFKDAANTLWIGTRDGLLVYREQSHSFVRPAEFADNPGLPDFTGLRIFMMTQGRTGDYWVATQDGLFRKGADGIPIERFHTEAPPGKRISANLVYRVVEDRDGLIWIATTDGLDRFDQASGSISFFRKTEGISNSLADNFITALCEDHNGNIWIGTSSYVNMFSKKDSLFTYYTKEHGLPGNQVYSILEDKTNMIWVATGNGLCRFDSVSHTFHAFSVEEGIQSQEFNLGASFLGKDGEVFFGGMNGFNSFYPDSLIFNTNIPNIVFTSAYKMGKGMKEYFDLEKSSKIVLAHNDYSLTVEFAALEFTNPSRNQFKYRLEGTGDEWIDIGNRNFIPFYNLSPGNYILTVLGSNNDGYWNELGATLTIVVRPPWWGSKVAYLAYVLSLMLTVWYIFKRREKQHIRDKMILEEKVKERTVQIEEQKTEILVKNAELKELNASKDKFFSIIAHDLRNPFNNIIGLSDLLLMNLDKTDRENLQKSLEDIKGSSEQAHQLLENLLLWARSHTGAIAFRPEPTDMNYLVRESVALVKTQAAQKQITIHTEIEKSCVILADVNMIRTVLRNLLTNALKFTHQKGDVWIRLTLENDFCTISFKDNGIGIPVEKISTLFRIDATYKSKGTRNEPGTGLGLTLCKELVEKHGGQIIVESEPEKGSEFRVILPVNKK